MAQYSRGLLPSESAGHCVAFPHVQVERYSQAANTDEDELSRMPTDSVPSCKQDTSDTEFQYIPDTPSEVVLSTPSIEFFSNA